MKKILALLIFYSVLSCHGIVEYYYIVENKSDKDLLFNYKHGYLYAKDSFTVCPAGKITIIDTVGVRGANPKDDKEKFLWTFNKLSVKTTDSINIKKDIHNRANWSYENQIEHFGVLKVGDNIYTIQITNDDIDTPK